MKSLRGRLLAWLLVPLVVVGVVATTGAYAFLQRRLTDAYDLDLGDIARALVPFIRMQDGREVLTIERQADAVLRADSTDQIYYSIVDDMGEVLAGEANMPRPPFVPNENARFYDASYAGHPIRVAVLRALVQGHPVQVMAAETTRKRERAHRDALLSAFVPTTLLSVAAVLAVLLGVRGGLRPVDDLRRQLKARTHLDLSPVHEPASADELRPLVNELNQMFLRLGQAQEVQAHFIANAAHQLRTPIAGLVTQIELARGSNDAVKRDAHLANARESATRLTRLAQQVLSLAAADPLSNPRVPDERFDLAEVVKDRAGEWLRRIDGRRVELGFELSPARVRGSSVLVGELASNLVDNAARYGAKTVTVVTRDAERSSVLEVIDDGPGIPVPERARIFERFRRLDNESTDGSGLGLAIVKEIAQRHRATIRVDDGPEGRGTRVAVSFPAVMENA
ncbi:MAG TPA: sensor histidine kinase [Usitatibacter sp.]|nr:sensor histidine kinase [Usitatibacter sp.]